MFGPPCLSLSLALLSASLAAPEAQRAPRPHVSPTMPQRPLSKAAQVAVDFAVPSPLRAPSAATIHLGERLFFDRRLSSDGTVSCATCHVPKLGFVDRLPTSTGVRGQRGQRNTPSVLNAALQEQQFWDGRTSTLELQAGLPITNPIEMGQPSAAAVEAVLRADPVYVADFNAIFGELTFARCTEALAAYERTQIALEAPFDAWREGDEAAVSTGAKRGFALFYGKARCTDCHGANEVNPLFSDQKFHNIGIAAHRTDFSALAARAAHTVDHNNVDSIDAMALQSDLSSLGRFLVTKQRHDIGAFKTQTLRNIGITAPYMHDGSLATLWDVADHYNRGGIANPYLDGGMQALGLSEPELDDLVAFLFTLTDSRYATSNAAEYRRQLALKRKSRPQRDTQAATGKTGDLGDVGHQSRDKNMGHAGAY